MCGPVENVLFLLSGVVRDFLFGAADGAIEWRDTVIVCLVTLECGHTRVAADSPFWWYVEERVSSFVILFIYGVMMCCDRRVRRYLRSVWYYSRCQQGMMLNPFPHSKMPRLLAGQRDARSMTSAGSLPKGDTTSLLSCPSLVGLGSRSCPRAFRRSLTILLWMVLRAGRLICSTVISSWVMPT